MDGNVIQIIITPVVLISAMGMVILSTANRFAKLADRITAGAQAALAAGRPGDNPAARKYHKSVLPLLRKRATMIYWALQSEYIGLTFFALTCLALAFEHYFKTGALLSVASLSAGIAFLLAAAGFLVFELKYSRKIFEINLDSIENDRVD